MATLFWIFAIFAGATALAYRRVDLKTATIISGAAFVVYWILPGGMWLLTLLFLVAVVAMTMLNFDDFRREKMTRPLLKFYRRMLPNMSETEREALNAGSVWWDGELFSGNPDWNKLLNYPKPTLSPEEQAFMDGPVEELCGMIDDWEITHELADLPPRVWDFLKSNGFFAMIIPKKYGGLEFSALAHSEVLTKVAGRSTTAASIIAVPNSLGPAELLHKYGTTEQKDHYLPRLARGEEIPCFALTSQRAGSDATSLTDYGTVCEGEFEGETVLGIKLNWNKRYITLAPVATVLGLAFKMYDPDKLIDGETDDFGITCALIPTHYNGVVTGRRHFPLNTPFQNGPTQGKDVFVPLDHIIGGPKMAGEGWRMLVESLTVGRCISLPSNATGGSKVGVAATGAYARIRRQFNLPIGKFEGVQKALARMAGRVYTMEASRVFTAGAVDLGEEPSVPSAIVKYHLTELSRLVANDAMDIHGGKAIMLGPKNYIGRGYQSVPIGITVEGANIMTRNLIIFGQGAIRCHPYVLKQMQAAMNEDEEQALLDFDKAFFSHFGHVISNAAHSFVMALSLARFTDVPVKSSTRRYYQHVNRFCASFALTADVAMLSLGGALKKKEMISARLGDLLSYMYMASAVLKRFEDQGRPEQDLPLVEWSCRNLLYQAQEQLHSIIRNFPNRPMAWLLRILVFPRGRTYSSPSDNLERSIAALMTSNTDSRARLIAGVYLKAEASNPVGLLNEILDDVKKVEPLMHKVRQAVKAGKVKEVYFEARIADAVTASVLTQEEADILIAYDARVMDLIDVDDFAPEELAVKKSKPAAVKKKTKKKAAGGSASGSGSMAAHSG